MSTTASQTPDQDRTHDRRRQRRALLAGGLVLGLGAAVTLAAFSDDEFAYGLFNTGKFNIEGSTDGSAYNQSPTADGDQLTFQLTSTRMAPGQTVYAPYWIRTDATTTLDGTATLNSVTGTGALAGLLTYRMASNSTTCDDTTTFDWVTSATSVSTVGTPNSPATLVHGTSAPGTPIKVCIAVTLSSDQAAVSAADNSTPTTVVWGWNAKSTDA